MRRGQTIWLVIPHRDRLDDESDRTRVRVVIKQVRTHKVLVQHASVWGSPGIPFWVNKTEVEEN